ncbi:hypothetical protein ACLOJK_013432 [Asimina triloba]
MSIKLKVGHAAADLDRMIVSVDRDGMGEEAATARATLRQAGGAASGSGRRRPSMRWVAWIIRSKQLPATTTKQILRRNRRSDELKKKTIGVALSLIDGWIQALKVGHKNQDWKMLRSGIEMGIHQKQRGQARQRRRGCRRPDLAADDDLDADNKVDISNCPMRCSPSVGFAIEEVVVAFSVVGGFAGVVDGNKLEG